MANKGKRDLPVEPGLTRAHVRRASSRVCPDRVRYEENASRIDLGLARTSARNGRDRALCIGSRAPPPCPTEGVSPVRDPPQSRRWPLGALFREEIYAGETYAQDAIRAVSGRYPCQAGIGRGPGRPAEMGRRSFGSSRPVQRTGASEALIREVRPNISEHRFVPILVCHSGADAVA